MSMFNSSYFKKILNALGISELDFNNLSEKAQKEFENEVNNMAKINILIIGKTGVGKSQLVNSMFRIDLAETGKGVPVSKEIKEYSKENFPLHLYDTQGLELDFAKNLEIKNEIKSVIKNLSKTGNESDKIHIIWYCINAMSDRIEEDEMKWINELAEINNFEIPVIIVLTKSAFESETLAFKKSLESHKLNVQAIIPVLSKEYTADKTKIKSFGLKELNSKTITLLPENIKTSYINAQKIDIEAKILAAKSVINKYSTGAGIIGVSPIPFADAPLLVSTQIKMLSSINKSFGIDFDKDISLAIMSSVVGVTMTTFLGKSLVSGIFKTVPGIGTAAGNIITGATALSLTKTLGEIYIRLLSGIAYGKVKLDKESVLAELKKLFKSKKL